MAAGDQVIIGKQFALRFGDAVWAGYQITGLTNSNTADVETIKDERSANVAHIISNPASVITINAYIKDDGSIIPPDIGDVVTITNPDGDEFGYIIASPATVTHGNSITTISATLTREDSLGAIYDAIAAMSIDQPEYTYEDSSEDDVDIEVVGSAAAVAAGQSSIVKSIILTETSTTNLGPGDHVPTTAYSYIGGDIRIFGEWLESEMTGGNSYTFEITLIGGAKYSVVISALPAP
jgi:hypothetical protein